MKIWSVVYVAEIKDSEAPSVEAFATQKIAFKRAHELMVFRRPTLSKDVLPLFFHLEHQERWDLMLDLFNHKNEHCQIFVEETEFKGHPLE